MIKANSHKISFQAIATTAVFVAGCLAIVFQLPDAQSLNDAFTGALSQDVLSNLGMLILVSALVAIVEEIVFRGILLEWLKNKFQKDRFRGIIFAIAISSVIFALFHALPIGTTAATLPNFIPEAYSAAWITVSLILKFLQAFFFGAILATLRFLPSKRNGIVQDSSSASKTSDINNPSNPSKETSSTHKSPTNIWKFLLLVIALHTLFDILYFAVPVIATGQFPQTYVITLTSTLAPTCITTVVFALTTALAYLRLRQNSAKSFDVIP